MSLIVRCFLPTNYAGAGEQSKPPAKRKLATCTTWSQGPVAPCDDPLLFYIGEVKDHGLNDLIKALNNAKISTGLVTVDAYAIRTPSYSFFGWENFAQNDRITKIFAAPKTNDWRFGDMQRDQAIKDFERAFPLICAFIEGWMANGK